jgi:hypothetical protein
MQILGVHVYQLPKDEVIPQAWTSLQGMTEFYPPRYCSLLVDYIFLILHPLLPYR